MPDIKSYTISNSWMDVAVCTLGCTITSINIPGKDSVERNVVLCYDDPHEYLDDRFYVGSTVGRVAGRISGSRFRIDDHFYKLISNDGDTGNHLHGGTIGFNKKIFELVSQDQHSLTLFYKSPDGEEGYPGEVNLWVTISLSDDNKVTIRYSATTDRKTHINLTNHTYFNFTGSREPATGHQLFINADYYVETDAQYIPTGALLPVHKTFYDFREQRRIDKFFSQMNSGYNECFVLNDDSVQAILFEPRSGIRMMINTSLPGLLVYTGDFLTDPFQKNEGVCLETQFFPDSPNQPRFPSTLMCPDQEYVHQTVMAFGHG